VIHPNLIFCLDECIHSFLFARLVTYVHIELYIEVSGVEPNPH
jgi:hypothetical protein